MGRKAGRWAGEAGEVEVEGGRKGSVYGGGWGAERAIITPFTKTQ